MIGIFDSGVGGTTVLREVRAALPLEPLLYLADQARVPYGPRDEQTIQQFSLDNTRWLLEQGASFILIACNTASAAALAWLREQLLDVIFVGMVPALKPAALSTQSGVVGVLATPTTMRGKLLRDVMAQWTEGVQVIEQVGLGLVEQIEAGELDTPATRELLWRYLEPMVAANADAVVMGCTHYLYLAPLIQEIAPRLRIVDAAPAVARRVVQVMTEHNLFDPIQDGQIRYATTGEVEPFRDFLQRVQMPPGTIEKAVLLP
jgi:glutamate racemase